jgi:hypothetical protein
MGWREGEGADGRAGEEDDDDGERCVRRGGHRMAGKLTPAQANARGSLYAYSGVVEVGGGGLLIGLGAS